MKAEIQYIANVLARRRSLEDMNLDWYYILGFTEMHKISGALYRSVVDGNIPISTQVLRKLQSVYNEQKCCVQFMRKWIKDLAYELDAAGVDYVFLKGSILAHTNFGNERVYTDGERISNDIDILLRPAEITKATKVLNALGFKQGYWDFRKEAFVPLSRTEIISRRMNRGETAPFIVTTDNVRVPFIEVDINFSVDYLPSGEEQLLEGILRSKRKYATEDNCGLISASPEWFFVHLILHQYKESVLHFMVERGKENDLYKLLDIYRLLHGNAVDMKAVQNIATAYGLTSRVCTVLQTVQKIFGGDIPEWASVEQSGSFVLIPSEDRRFEWIVPIEERIATFNRLPFLREVK